MTPNTAEQGGRVTAEQLQVLPRILSPGGSWGTSEDLFLITLNWFSQIRRPLGHEARRLFRITPFPKSWEGFTLPLPLPRRSLHRLSNFQLASQLEI